MSLGGSSPYQFPPAQDGSPFNSSARHYSSFSEAESRPGMTAEQVYERYPAAKKKRKRKCWQKCHKRGWVMLALLVSIALLIVFVSLFIHEKLSNKGYWEPEPIFPPSVGANSLVGFISPASPIFFEPGWNASNYPGHVAEIVDGLSLRFEFATHAFETYGSLAGPDADRASDVMEMFKDPTVSFIVSNRGGWGCNRIIDMLTYSTIAANAKPLMGYSDLTGLLNAIHSLTGLVTFHGPMGLDPWNNITYSYVSSIIMRGEKAVLRNSPNYPDWQTITGGKARGRLIGGNLSVFVAMLGSDYLPPPEAFSNYILFLEEVGEEPYVIDRYMTMLHLSGILDQVAGFVWGRCTACTASVPAHSFTWQEIIVQKIQPLGVPSFMGGMFGHDLSEQYVLPIGVMAELDADKATITLLESAVTLPSLYP